MASCHLSNPRRYWPGYRKVAIRKGSADSCQRKTDRVSQMGLPAGWRNVEMMCYFEGLLSVLVLCAWE
jgi:hypothetical protein